MRPRRTFRGTLCKEDCIQEACVRTSAVRSPWSQGKTAEEKGALVVAGPAVLSLSHAPPYCVPAAPASSAYACSDQQPCAPRAVLVGGASLGTKDVPFWRACAAASRPADSALERSVCQPQLQHTGDVCACPVRKTFGTELCQRHTPSGARLLLSPGRVSGSSSSTPSSHPHLCLAAASADTQRLLDSTGRTGPSASTPRSWSGSTGRCSSGCTPTRPRQEARCASKVPPVQLITTQRRAESSAELSPRIHAPRPGGAGRICRAVDAGQPGLRGAQVAPQARSVPGAGAGPRWQCAGLLRKGCG